MSSTSSMEMQAEQSMSMKINSTRTCEACKKKQTVPKRSCCNLSLNSKSTASVRLKVRCLLTTKRCRYLRLCTQKQKTSRRRRAFGQNKEATNRKQISRIMKILFSLSVLLSSRVAALLVSREETLSLNLSPTHVVLFTYFRRPKLE